MWPEIERPQNVKKTVSYSTPQLDPLGPELKKQVMDDTMALVAYIMALEAALNAYDKVMKDHNKKFEATVVKVQDE